MKALRAVFFTLIFSPALLAQHQTFAVSPEASEVKIKLNTTHEVVNGMFHIQSGSIDFDRTASDIAGMIIVAAGSGKTGNGSRDKKMNKDILKVEQFTSCLFCAQSVHGNDCGLRGLNHSGDRRLHSAGTPHNLTIPMQIHIDGPKATAMAQFSFLTCSGVSKILAS